MKGNYKIYPIGRETSASGGYGLFIESSRLLDTTFRYIEDAFGNNSALKLNRATADGFVMVEAPNAANTAGIYVAVAGTIIGDFRADLTNGFAMVAQSTYPISFYTNNTATKNASFNSDGSSSFYGTNGIVHVKTGNIIEFTRNSANYFHASASGGDFRWTVNGAAVASSSMLLTTSGNLVVGHSSASARMHVRGDGTNPIARFESSTGTYFASISQFAFGTIFSMNGFSITENTSSLIFASTSTGTGAIGTLPIYDFIASSDLSTASTSNFFRVNRAITPSAGSANFRPFTVRYTINATGAQTGNLTGILLDANETALNGMTHNLMDLQIGGSSKFRVRNNNNIDIFSATQLNWSTYNAFIYHDGSSFQFSTPQSIVFNAASNLYKFGGATNLFPALKRNGNTLEVRLADDSGYTALYAGTLLSTGSIAVGAGVVNMLGGGDGILRLTNAAVNDFNRIQFGGSTNAFPAIKRNGVGLQIRRADDSAYSDLEASTYLAAAGIVYMNTSGNVFIIRGTGSPEGVQAASVGSLYMRTDGGANTTLYVKESGTGNTGWVAK